MKKLLLPLFCLLAATIPALADTVISVNFKDLVNGSSSSYNATETTISESNYDFITCNYIPSSGQIRGNQSTVSKNFYIYNTTAIPNIEKVILTLSSSSSLKSGGESNTYLQVASEAITTASATGNNCTIDGQQLIFVPDETDKSFFRIQFANSSTTGAVILETIEIYTNSDDASGVSNPIIDPSTQTFISPFDATITAEEGADIHYTLDGSEPTAESPKYAEPINISQTTTLKAIAVKDGESSGVTTAVYTYAAVDNIAEWLEKAAADQNNSYTITGEVTVSVSSYEVTDGSDKRYVWITDETGCLLVYGSSLSYAAGQTFTGLSGQYTLYYNNPQMQSSNMASLTPGEGSAPQPTETTVAGITTADANSYIKLDNVTVDSAAKTFTQDDSSIAYYDRFSLSLFEDGDYDVTGIAVAYNSAMQIYPVSAIKKLTAPTITVTCSTGATVADGARVAEDEVPVTVVVTNDNADASMTVTLVNTSNNQSQEETCEAGVGEWTSTVSGGGVYKVSVEVYRDDESVASETSFTIEGDVEYTVLSAYVKFLDEDGNEVASPSTVLPLTMVIGNENVFEGETVTMTYTVNDEEYTSTESEVEIAITKPGTITYSVVCSVNSKSVSEEVSGAYTVTADAVKLEAPEISFSEITEGDYVTALEVTVTNPNVDGVGTIMYCADGQTWHEGTGTTVTFTLEDDGTYTIQAYVRNDSNSNLNSDVATAQYNFTGIEQVSYGVEGVKVVGGNIVVPEDAAVYSINGIRVSALDSVANGIYIVRLANGATTKIIVK